MKKILILVLMVIGLKAYSQIPMEAKYEFNNAVYFDDSLKLERLNTSADDSLCVYRDGTNGRLFWGTCASGGGGYWSIQGDSLIYPTNLSKRVIIGDSIYSYKTISEKFPNLTLNSDTDPTILQMIGNKAQSYNYSFQIETFGDNSRRMQFTSDWRSIPSKDTAMIFDYQNSIVKPNFHSQSNKSYSASVSATESISGIADTTILIDLLEYQGGHIYIDSSVSNILIDVVYSSMVPGYIQDYSLTIETDTNIVPPSLTFAANEFQLVNGIAPTLTTVKSQSTRFDIITFRYDGTAAKRLKVLPVTDFRNN